MLVSSEAAGWLCDKPVCVLGNVQTNVGLINVVFIVKLVFIVVLFILFVKGSVKRASSCATRLLLG